MSESIVSVRGASRIYRQGDNEVRALSNVSLEIARGEFVSLCGPSGSGKSTLLNLIGGLDRPTSGSVLLAGRDLGLMSERELAATRLRSIGFIFQSYNLIPVLSVRENVEFVLELQGVTAKERHARSQLLIERLGLGGMQDRRPAELSGGQQQRVAIARAIISNPDIVLADEPTANLDSKTATMLLELMRTMNEERGITFIFSTHDALVMRYAKRLVRLHDGALVESADTPPA